MTILDDRQQGRRADHLSEWGSVAQFPAVRDGRLVEVRHAEVRHAEVRHAEVRHAEARRQAPRLSRAAGRPGRSRPSIAPLAYRGSGLAVSAAPHAVRRPVSASTTIALAGLAALITLWLGVLGHFSGAQATARADIPERLGVVQVHAGETLQQLASRMVPDAPVSQVVDRIRHLNNLDSPEVDAGQTLIAPLG